MNVYRVHAGDSLRRGRTAGPHGHPFTLPHHPLLRSCKKMQEEGKERWYGRCAINHTHALLIVYNAKSVSLSSEGSTCVESDLSMITCP